MTMSVFTLSFCSSPQGLSTSCLATHQLTATGLSPEFGQQTRPSEWQRVPASPPPELPTPAISSSIQETRLSSMRFPGVLIAHLESRKKHWEARMTGPTAHTRTPLASYTTDVAQPISCANLTRENAFESLRIASICKFEHSRTPGMSRSRLQIGSILLLPR